MNLMTYHPQDLFNVTDGVKEWMNGSFPKTVKSPGRNWPCVNVWEKENEYVLEAEVPGLKSEDIQLDVLNNHLIIKGTVTRDANETPPQFKIWEFERKSFERSFQLGEIIDQEKISAKTENGMLYVIMPKKEKAQPRKIEIASGA